jgi:hypothetical protein
MTLTGDSKLALTLQGGSQVVTSGPTKRSLVLRLFSAMKMTARTPTNAGMEVGARN